MKRLRLMCCDRFNLSMPTTTCVISQYLFDALIAFKYTIHLSKTARELVCTYIPLNYTNNIIQCVFTGR